MDMEMRYYEKNEMGTIQISPQVVERIAKLTAEEVKGVHSLSGGLAREFVDFLGRKTSTKGIHSQVGQREVAIDISVVIEYGQAFLNVAQELQKQIKHTIESMTDLTVIEINVHINGIHYGDK